MIILELAVKGQKLTTTEVKTVPVAFTKGVYEVLFTPSDDFWSGEADGHITAVFRGNMGGRHEVPLTDYQCSIPQDALGCNWFTIGLYFKQDKRIYPTEYTGFFFVRDGVITTLPG